MSTDTVTVYLGLGGNVGDVSGHFKHAQQALIRHPEIQSFKCSSIYQSKPWGGGIIDVSAQEDYLNQVVEIKTSLSASKLLGFCQRIEHQRGRNHLANRWSARALDIDILLYGNEQVSSVDLEIPHPRMLQRAFVLLPLYELSPNLIIPDAGSVKVALASLEADELSSAFLVK